jgi:hypothetical protein
MREQIQRLLRTVPFEPFSIDVAPDVAWSIPTPDHAFPSKSVLVIEDDDRFVHLVSYEHIRQIVHRQPASR